MFVLNLPNEISGVTYTERICRLKGLDHHQEALARKFDGGHRIIVGPSGSGKTLILVHKAAFLKQYNRKIKNILFVCYNITLVNYIKRLLANKNVPMGDNGVTVKHFYELCSDILGETVAYENESQDYYDLIVEEALTKVQDYENRYDAILVDEGQDLNDSMYKVITSLLNPQTNNLTIALDDNQNIYERQSSWKAVGVQARGRIHKISYVYRNTKEITTFTSRFLGKECPLAMTTPRPSWNCCRTILTSAGQSRRYSNFPTWNRLSSSFRKKFQRWWRKTVAPILKSPSSIPQTIPAITSEDSLAGDARKGLETKGIPCS